MKIPKSGQTQNILRPASLAALCLAALGLGPLAGCSSRPPDTPAVPSWVRQSARSEGSGAIFFVESDDDVASDAAAEKAEALAYLDAANECSFVPKGSRFDDRYFAKTAHLRQVHVRLRVDAAACESAKKAFAPEAIRAQADREAFAAIVRFNRKNGEPALEEASAADEAKALLIARQRLAALKHRLAEAPAGKADSAPAGSVVALSREIAKKMAAQNASIGPVSIAWSQVRHELMRPKFGADGAPVVVPSPPAKAR